LVAVFILIKRGAPDATEGSWVGDTAGTGAVATASLVGALAPGGELGELAVDGAVEAVTVVLVGGGRAGLATMLSSDVGPTAVLRARAACERAGAPVTPSTYTAVLGAPVVGRCKTASP
jgi:hypothetical protein